MSAKTFQEFYGAGEFGHDFAPSYLKPVFIQGRMKTGENSMASI